MDSVLRAAAIYLVVLVVFRLAGRRTLSELTTFDFVLLLIIGEATQQALLGDDFSIVNAMVVIVSLVVFDIALSLLKNKSRWLSKLADRWRADDHRRAWPGARTPDSQSPYR